MDIKFGKKTILFFEEKKPLREAWGLKKLKTGFFEEKKAPAGSLGPHQACTQYPNTLITEIGTCLKYTYLFQINNN